MLDDVVFGKDFKSYEKTKNACSRHAKNETHQVKVDVKLYLWRIVRKKYEVKDLLFV